MRVTFVKGIEVIHLEGAYLGGPETVELATRIGQDLRPIVLNCSRALYFDSKAIRVLLGATERFDFWGSVLPITSVQPEVMRILRLSERHPTLKFYASLEQAVDALYEVRPGTVFRTRNFRPGDASGLRWVCFQTACLGSPADAWTSLPDVITRPVIDPYIREFPKWISVVTLGDIGPVVGYLTGCPDTMSYLHYYETVVEPQLRHDALVRGIWLHPGSAGLFWQYVIDQAFERRQSTAYDPHHPAHFHLNLLPIARRRGLGRELARGFLERMASSDVHGCFVETAASNQPAVAFFRQLGFEPGQSHKTPGIRIQGKRIHNCRMTKILS